jgi:hypothetical protein
VARCDPALPALRAVQQLVVGQHQRHHRRDHRRAADADAGSWRPLVASWVASPSRVIVSCAVRIELVGLNATRTTTGCPVEMPPAIPPAWLAVNSGAVVARAHRVGVLLAAQRCGAEALADLDAP